MNTMMINSLWMHMEKRQYRAIKESIQAAFTESSLPLATFRKSDDEEKVHCVTDRKTILKSIHHFLTKQVVCAVSGAPDASLRKPNPKNYKKHISIHHAEHHRSSQNYHAGTNSATQESF
jgi:hypothetical protein